MRQPVEVLEDRTLLAAVAVSAPAGELDVARHELALDLAAGLTTTGGEEQFYHLFHSETAGLLQPQMETSESLINLDAFRADPRFAGMDGGGFAVVVLDTGLQVDHPHFGPDLNGDGVADRIVFQYDFFEGNHDASDYNGHGTHVTGTVASGDPALSGVAPGVDIIHLKIFADDMAANPLTSTRIIEEALQWVVENAAAYNVYAVNMSIGGGNHQTAQMNHALRDEFAALAQLNVLAVAASGNSFHDYESVQGVAMPSADPDVISVGSVWSDDFGGPIRWGAGAIDYTTGADRVVSHSQRHEVLTDVLAPGAFVEAAWLNGGTRSIAGTSMASPHVAGAAILAQQVATQYLGRPLDVNEFRALLRSTGVMVNDGDDEDDNVANTGADFPRLDMLALAEEIVAMASPSSADLSGAVSFDGSDGNDVLTVTVADGTSGTYVWTSDGAEVARGRLTDVTRLTFNGGKGNDTLIIKNPAGSLFAPADGIVFHGGTGEDTLQVLGGQSGGIEHRFTETGGALLFAEGGGTPLVTHTGLASILDTIAADERTFTFTGGDETLTLADDATHSGRSRITSTPGTSIRFTNPRASLTLDTEAAGQNLIRVQGLDAGFDADVTVNAGDADEVAITGAITLGNTLAVNRARTTTLTAPLLIEADGALRIDGDALLAEGSRLLVEISGAGPVAREQVSVSGSLRTDAEARLTVIFEEGFTPAHEQSFTIVSRERGDGSFLGLDEGTLFNTGNGVFATITYSGGAGSDVLLTVQNLPPSVSLTNRLAALSEDAPTGQRTKVADVVVTQLDVLGTNLLSLSGRDADAFEIDGTELFLKAGTPLDIADRSQFRVTVEVNDPELVPDPNDTVELTIDVLPANSPPEAFDQTFRMAPGTPTGDVIGTFSAADADLGQTLTYTITGGTGMELFTIDSTNGRISVVDSAGINFTAAGSYTLEITVTDDGDPPRSTSATATILPGEPLDLLLWSETSGIWYRGLNVDGQFQQQVGHRWATSVTWDFHQGDFTGNGLTDVAGRQRETGQWFVFSATEGGFTTTSWGRWGSDEAAGWTDVLVGDFNGDGRDDVVGRTANGQIWVAESTGTGFTSRYYGDWSAAGWASSEWKHVVVGDFNGDGRDGIAGMRESGHWFFAQTNAGGRFTTTLVGRWSGTAGWQNVMAADFTGDGRSDLIGQTATGQWWIGASRTTSLETFYGGAWSTTAGFGEVLVGDFDGNGRADLASRNAHGEWWVLRSNGVGERMTSQYWGRWSPASEWQMVVGDFTGNGRSDVAGYEVDTGRIWVAVSTGEGFTNTLYGQWQPLDSVGFATTGRLN